jgi:hypothetical protein
VVALAKALAAEAAKAKEKEKQTTSNSKKKKKSRIKNAKAGHGGAPTQEKYAKKEGAEEAGEDLDVVARLTAEAAARQEVH